MNFDGHTKRSAAFRRLSYGEQAVHLNALGRVRPTVWYS
jgi:hypothetical protein